MITVYNQSKAFLTTQFKIACSYHGKYIPWTCSFCFSIYLQSTSTRFLSITTYFNSSSRFAHFSVIRYGFFFIFLKIYLYSACTASPQQANAQANPQKNLQTVSCIRMIRISVMKDVSFNRFSAPICVNMYFTPANAAVYTDGMKIKIQNLNCHTQPDMHLFQLFWTWNVILFFHLTPPPFLKSFL